MGVYIKGMTLEQFNEFMDILGGVMNPSKLIEVTEPHGRFVDESKIHTGIRMEKNTEYRYFIDRVNAPTVIEAEGE